MTESTNIQERMRTYISAFDSLRDEHTNASEIAHRDMIADALERLEVLEEALEEIAEDHDAGRHDGLPEPCPALDADTMFAIARRALATPHQWDRPEVRMTELTVRDLRERLEALEADAARWRWIRQALEVDGDFTDGGHGSHAQWLYVDEEKLLPATREGWSHTVESLVDAAIASATPAPAGQSCPHLHQSELGSTGGLRWQCLYCGEWSTEPGLRVGEVHASETLEEFATALRERDEARYNIYQDGVLVSANAPIREYPASLGHSIVRVSPESQEGS